MHHGSTEMLQAASDSLDVVAGLIRTFPEIDFVTLAELTVPPVGTNKLIMRDAAVKIINDEALDLREKFNIPFWMAIASVAQSYNATLPSELLRAAAFHQSMASVDVDLERVAAQSMTSEYLRERSRGIHPTRILTFSSQVRLKDQSIAHFPMLDFRIAPSRANLSTVITMLGELGHDGVILNSGQSYHFYGITLLSVDELREFLGKALLFTPIVDYRWIGHQLIEGACALRLSSGTKRQSIPTVTAAFTRQFGAT